MFDDIHISVKSPDVNYVTRTVHEHKAPTDDSLKLLKEMQEKALHSIIDSFKVESNTMNGHIVVFKDYYAFKFMCGYKFELNGTTFIDKFDIGADYLSRGQLCEILAEKLSRQITLLLLSGVDLSELPRR
jgi:hypothetical protein